MTVNCEMLFCVNSIMTMAFFIVKTALVKNVKAFCIILINTKATRVQAFHGLRFQEFDNLENPSSKEKCDITAF